jgi:hypothetical protein
MQSMFEPLRKSGLIKRGKLQRDVFGRLSLKKILDVFDEATAVTSQVPTTSQLAGRTHCASIGLSGGIGECDAPSCRLKRADEVARFGALYSDHVLIHNSLADLSPSFGHEPNSDSEEVRERLFTDLSVITHLRPLIEKRILIPYSTPQTYCSDCFATMNLGDDAGARFKNARRRLEQELLNSMAVELDGWDETTAGIAVTGQKSWFEHGSRHIVVDPNQVPALKARPTILKKLRNEQSFFASATLTKALNIHERFAEQAMGNAAYQMTVANLTGADYLSHRRADLDVLQGITCEDKAARTNAVLAQNWKNIVPFAGDVSLARLTKLRSRQREAFVRFRSALDVAVEEAMGDRNTISAKDARSLFADVIQPELGRLDQSVSQAKKDLVVAPLSSAAGITAAIGIGALSGMLAVEFMAVAKALGLGKVIYDAVKGTIGLGDIRKGIRQEPYYYLWRVRREQSKTSHNL